MIERYRDKEPYRPFILGIIRIKKKKKGVIN